MTPNNTPENQLQQSTPSGLSLKDRLKLTRNQPALLLDISGSMQSDCEPGLTKIQALRDIVSNLKGNHKVYAFNTSCHPCLKTAIPDPTGGTYMAGAFDALKQQGIRSVVMITDGEAQDKQAALDAVKGLTLQIMYVGPGQKPSFLDELAKAGNGGFCTVEDLKQQKELTEKITLLIEGCSGNEQRGPICL